MTTFLLWLVLLIVGIGLVYAVPPWTLFTVLLLVAYILAAASMLAVSLLVLVCDDSGSDG